MKWMVTPYSLSGEPGLALLQPMQAVDASTAGVLGARVLNSSTVVVQLRAATQAREIAVEVRRVGKQCAAARVSLTPSTKKSDDAAV